MDRIGANSVLDDVLHRLNQTLLGEATRGPRI